MVEGVLHLGDGFEHAAHILQNVDRCDTYQLVAVARQERVPDGVSLWSITTTVRLAINFDHHGAFANIEINNVWADRMLSADLEPEFLAPELVPQHRFG